MKNLKIHLLAFILVATQHQLVFSMNQNFVAPSKKYLGLLEYYELNGMSQIHDPNIKKLFDGINSKYSGVLSSRELSLLGDLYGKEKLQLILSAQGSTFNDFNKRFKEGFFEKSKTYQLSAVPFSFVSDELCYTALKTGIPTKDLLYEDSTKKKNLLKEINSEVFAPKAVSAPQNNQKNSAN